MSYMQNPFSPCFRNITDEDHFYWARWTGGTSCVISKIAYADGAESWSFTLSGCPDNQIWPAYYSTTHFQIGYSNGTNFLVRKSDGQVSSILTKTNSESTGFINRIRSRQGAWAHSYASGYTTTSGKKGATVIGVMYDAFGLTHSDGSLFEANYSPLTSGGKDNNGGRCGLEVVVIPDDGSFAFKVGFNGFNGSGTIQYQNPGHRNSPNTSTANKNYQTLVKLAASGTLSVSWSKRFRHATNDLNFGYNQAFFHSTSSTRCALILTGTSNVDYTAVNDRSLHVVELDMTSAPTNGTYGSGEGQVIIYDGSTSGWMLEMFDGTWTSGSATAYYGYQTNGWSTSRLGSLGNPTTSGSLTVSNVNSHSWLTSSYNIEVKDVTGTSTHKSFTANVAPNFGSGF